MKRIHNPTRSFGRVAGVCAVVLISSFGCAIQPDRNTAAPKRAEPASLGIDAAHLNAERDAMLADIQAGVVPGAVMVVGRNGKIAWEQTLGKQSPNDSTPMSLDTIFRIQSMTKPIV